MYIYIYSFIYIDIKNINILFFVIFVLTLHINSMERLQLNGKVCYKTIDPMLFYCLKNIIYINGITTRIRLWNYAFILF